MAMEFGQRSGIIDAMVAEFKMTIDLESSTLTVDGKTLKIDQKHENQDQFLGQIWDDYKPELVKLFENDWVILEVFDILF